MADFWHLDGHGVYVWPAYGLAALVLLYFALAAVIRYRALKTELEKRGAGRGRRTGRGAADVEVEG